MENKTALRCKCNKQFKIAEREFYYYKIKVIGTRLICLKCGENKFIKD